MSTSLTTSQIRWVKIGSSSSEPEPARVVFDHTGAVTEVWLMGSIEKGLAAQHLLIGDLVAPAVTGTYLEGRKAKPILPQEPGVRESDDEA